MTIAIDGMHCQACVMRVRKALEQVPGVHIKTVGIGSVELEMPHEAESSALKAIEKAGYTPHVPV